jgi:hypothetical protein
MIKCLHTFPNVLLQSGAIIRSPQINSCSNPTKFQFLLRSLFCFNLLLDAALFTVMQKEEKHTLAGRWPMPCVSIFGNNRKSPLAVSRMAPGRKPRAQGLTNLEEFSNLGP